MTTYARFDGPFNGSAPARGLARNFPTASPTDGGRVDLLTPVPVRGYVKVAAVGHPHQVQLAEAVTAGDLLATDATGKARQAGTGDVVVSRFKKVNRLNLSWTHHMVVAGSGNRHQLLRIAAKHGWSKSELQRIRSEERRIVQRHHLGRVRESAGFVT